MRYKSISYCATYPTVQFGNERPAVEIELSQGDDPMQVLIEAKKFLERFHRETNPHLYVNGSTVVKAVPKEAEDKLPPEETREAIIIRDIQSCKDFKVLESYRFIAKSNPEFQKAYDYRLHQLQQLVATPPSKSHQNV